MTVEKIAMIFQHTEGCGGGGQAGSVWRGLTTELNQKERKWQGQRETWRSCRPWRYDLHQPRYVCQTCLQQRAPDVRDLVRSGHWPASANASTIYTADLLNSFQELKWISLGFSRQALSKAAGTSHTVCRKTHNSELALFICQSAPPAVIQLLRVSQARVSQAQVFLTPSDAYPVHSTPPPAGRNNACLTPAAKPDSGPNCSPTPSPSRRAFPDIMASLDVQPRLMEARPDPDTPAQMRAAVARYLAANALKDKALSTASPSPIQPNNKSTPSPTQHSSNSCNPTPNPTQPRTSSSSCNPTPNPTQHQQTEGRVAGTPHSPLQS
ncbi:unnamed protein product [Boreogadus saida]